ncbi:MAG: SAM-dependent methyltransferase [Fimbriimonadaceae bacterium]|nr:SAM-dependent methyltransferase [Chitinophagales bacterium]
MQKGKLYLIPTILNAEALHVIPAYVHTITGELKVFFVENEKTARRYLRKTGYDKPFDEITILPLSEHTAEIEYASYINYLQQGNSCGLLSEAGVPAVADPGSGFIKLCHLNTIQVIPLVGPSSIILALMSSGLNGQQFSFHGYLPVKQPDRNNKIQQIELKAKSGETQIFIETPYRNNSMINDILQTCNASTLFCIASDLTGTKEFIQTKTVADWKKNKPSLEKIPTIFLLGNA